MGNVHEPPDEVIVVGYVWTNGSALGGKREAFLSTAEAENRLAQLLANGEIARPDKVTVLRLGERTWQPVKVHLPESLRLEPEDAA